MRYSYLQANEGEFTFREDTETDHAEGFVVYDVDTNEAQGVYATEEEARQVCAKLNGSGP
jgi:hypothetical protein